LLPGGDSGALWDARGCRSSDLELARTPEVGVDPRLPAVTGLAIGLHDILIKPKRDRGLWLAGQGRPAAPDQSVAMTQLAVAKEVAQQFGGTWPGIHPLLANPPAFTHNSPLNASGGFMFAIGSGNFRFGLMLAALLSLSILPDAARAYTPEQEQACTNDAFRLCSAEIPDVDRVTACMVRNKSQLSPPCRAQFRPEPEVAVTPVAAGRPLSIKPATARKPVSAKTRKPKKPAKPAAT
jgi:hypothetical protein